MEPRSPISVQTSFLYLLRREREIWIDKEKDVQQQQRSRISIDRCACTRSPRECDVTERRNSTTEEKGDLFKSSPSLWSIRQRSHMTWTPVPQSDGFRLDKITKKKKELQFKVLGL